MNKNSQNGNAIIMILVAVALFAALGYAFSNTSRTSTSFITDEQAKAHANQIIAYSNEIKSTVKRLLLRGCKDTEISFENNIVAGYTNANSPTDKSCHLFDIAGGGITWNNNSSKINNGDPYLFMGNANILEVGTSENELSLFLPEVNSAICIKLNKIFNLDTTPNPLDGLNGLTITKFIGDYTLEETFGGVSTEHKRQKAFCFKEISTGKLYFNYVLLAR